MRQALEDEGVDVLHGKAVSNVTKGQIRCEDGSQVWRKPNLIVAADGARSTLRSLVHPHIGDRILASRGYYVCRGFNRIDVPCIEEASGFQTWGASRRFAAVPIPNGGNAWFAAISCDLAEAAMGATLLKSDDSENRRIHEGCKKIQDADRGVSDREMEDLARQGREWLHQGGGSLPMLEHLFSGWHQPIGTLLQGTSPEDVTCVMAEAFTRVVPGGFSRAGGEPDNFSVDIGVPVAFLGDAAHTLDPILAQGSGVAIEDAEHLAMLIGGVVHNGMNLSSALATYERQRIGRLERLHHLSNWAQRVGHMTEEAWCTRRDYAMRAIPAFAKAAGFDAAVRASLTGRVCD